MLSRVFLVSKMVWVEWPLCVAPLFLHLSLASTFPRAQTDSTQAIESSWSLTLANWGCDLGWVLGARVSSVHALCFHSWQIEAANRRVIGRGSNLTTRTFDVCRQSLFPRLPSVSPEPLRHARYPYPWGLPFFSSDSWDFCKFVWPCLLRRRVFPWKKMQFPLHCYVWTLENELFETQRVKKKIHH